MLRIYGLKNCSTCKKVIGWLDEAGVEHESLIDIRENPPQKEDIVKALDRYDGKKKRVMNTSGNDYRESGLKDQVDDMTEEEVAQRLSENGMLVKRPLIISGEIATAGSTEEDIRDAWM